MVSTDGVLYAVCDDWVVGVSESGLWAGLVVDLAAAEVGLVGLC